MGCGERLERVVFDTSILLLLYEGVPVFDEVSQLLSSKPQCIVPRPVLEELERMAKLPSPKRSRAARLALQAIRRWNCRIVDTASRSADDAILEIVSSDCGAIAATADGELRRRLREKGLPNIYYRRSRHGLMVEG